MRSIVFTLLLACVMPALAQKPADVLATATGHTFKLSDLPEQVQTAVAGFPGNVTGTRKAIYDQLVNTRLVEIEAKSLGISNGKLLANEKAKIPNPTEADIKKVYDDNRAALGDLTLEKARKQIVGYLRNAPEQKALAALFERLKVKYKYTAGKDVNAVNLAAADTIANINGQAITAKQFEDFARPALYELNAGLGDVVRQAIDDAIFNALVVDEAKALGIDSGELIAREITGKMKDFTDDERFRLEAAFGKRLAAKYNVAVLYKVPEPPVQQVSVDDDPSQGPADAPVTIVMFSDFQCSACSATHPILKQAIAAYPGKIRFVVRDFPLESIHENGYRAALAAGAANLQGKFFEYIEKLYAHQDALDDASLKKYAADLGLNAKQFELDFNSEKVAAEVRHDMADGDAAVVNSTPTIFINGIRVRDLSVDNFKAVIDRALAK